MIFRYMFLVIMMLPPLAASGDDSVMNVVTSEYPPYGYVSDGEVVGKDTQLIRQILSEMGYQARIRALPWARAERLVRTGEADMLYSLTFSEARARHYYFTDPISSARDVFFKHKNRNLQWQTLDDLTGLNFGLSAAYSYAPEFMDWLFNGNARITRITHEKPELTGLRMLALDRVDLFICEQSVCEYILELETPAYPELANIDQIPGTVGSTRDFHAAFSRKLPNGRELQSQFNKTLADIRSTGDK